MENQEIQTCKHDYQELNQNECLARGIQKVGRFHHVFECKKCKKTYEYESD